MDATSQKIIDSTMSLVRDKDYVATTTKDIAKQAGVNECTQIIPKFVSLAGIIPISSMVLSATLLKKPINAYQIGK